MAALGPHAIGCVACDRWGQGRVLECRVRGAAMEGHEVRVTHTHTCCPPPPDHTQGPLCFCQSINDSNTWTLLARILRCPRNPLTWQIHTNHCAPLSVDTPLLFSRGKNKQNTIQPQGTSFIPRNTPSVHFQWNIYSQRSQIEVQVLPRRAV